jgi:tRNA-5-methyluridine54 2-sulfurtransferase
MSTMICHKCDQRAVIRMHQHRLQLCKTHYLEWFVTQTERVIKKYHLFWRDARILVAVSGGKDSLALWDILCRLGYSADGLYIDLGIHGDDNYSVQSQVYAQDFAAERNLNLQVIHTKESFGETIPELARRNRRGRVKPCAVCGLVKRHTMNRVTYEGGYDVLVTGHNLDDEAAVLFGNAFNWEANLLRRQAPLLEGVPGFARKAKPFCRFYERETAAYVLLRGIEYEYEECPYARGSTSLYYKHLLNQIEAEQPGAKLRFYVNFLKARKEGLFSEVKSDESDHYSQRCSNCGQPSTAEGLCAFCRLFDR